MLRSIPSPRPVPAAMTATLPLAILAPSCRTASSSPLEHRDRVRHRLEVVEQADAAEAVPHHLRRVDAPRDVGQLRNLIRYRARNAERRSLDAR